MYLSSQESISRRALHVGCGTSMLGIMVLLERSWNIDLVVNTDNDEDALDFVRRQWKQISSEHDANGDALGEMEFRRIDYADPKTASPQAEEFDLVLDKSTLDCFLCTDTAASNMLCNVYNSIRPNGLYIIVSFHSMELLRPLIADLPGSRWETHFHVIDRQVENLRRRHNPTPSSCAVSQSGRDIPFTTQTSSTTTMCTRSTNLSATPGRNESNRTVNVIVARKLSSGQVEADAVYDHVHKVNNIWFASLNPILTSKRQDCIAASFSFQKELDITTCYQILFTDNERENYDMTDFLSDWTAFLSTNTALPNDVMTYETAMAFLREMQ